MRYIFDPTETWLAQLPFGQSQSNKRPVAINDALSVDMDSGPVVVDVLANDFDPEGGPLTLMSAIAALGTATAEANGTVTYTPPLGVSGFDTVVYTIADDQGQTRDGQIDIEIVAPRLQISTLSDNTFVVTAETGPIDIDITAPSAFAGNNFFDTCLLYTSPSPRD